MARIHLFEFEDQSWFPAFLRNYMTDFLGFLSLQTKMYQPMVPIIAKLLDRLNTHKIVDLASGGGGGLSTIISELTQESTDLQVTLTDFYPNTKALSRICASHDNVSFSEESVDALHVPSALTGFRTMFLSFHHFLPDQAKQILQNAVDSKQGILIVEAQERSAPSILAMLFSPITVLLTTPFIKPFSLGRLVFTYLIPLVPILSAWDGVVSALRTYSKDEMKGLIQSLENSTDYEFEVHRIKNGPGVLIYTFGLPK